MAATKKIVIKNLNALAEVELCLGKYLDTHIKSVMKDVRKDLTAKQIKETAEYESSWRGILGRLADSMSGSLVDTNSQFLKATGVWNSKTTDDYLAMCRNKVLKDKVLYHDIASLTMEWRNVIVKEVGQKRYDELSKKIGADLAGAYVDYRIQQTMMDVLIDEKTPKTTSEYIITKGTEGSLIGFARSLNQSETDAQIAREAEKRYKASGWEWAGARATSFAVDTVSTMGFGSWGSIAKLAGAEVVFAGAEYAYDKVKDRNKALTIEQCISQGVFGATTKTNVFTTVRQIGAKMDAPKSEGVARINANLKRPVVKCTVAPKATKVSETVVPAKAKAVESPKGDVKSQSAESELASLSTEPKVDSTKELDSQSEEDKIRQEQQANQEGWAELMGELGYSGMGDIGHNLGYVIAMLPDILVGMMTGKTQSLHLRDNMIPMASVVAGMFVKNPILKTVLIGMGGMNLLNKAGHESLARHANPDGPRYKQYQDEPLNPRITEPVINGNCLVANIDRTPCSILLPDNVVAAHRSGALPLNTLANAVLAKHDAGTEMSQSNYRSVMQDNNIQNNRQLR